MSFPILSSLIILPTIGAIFILVGRSSSNYNAAKYISLFVTLANFILSLYLWYIFEKTNSDFQFVEERVWLEEIDRSEEVGRSRERAIIHTR